MKNLFNFLKCNKGSPAVEFALVAPVLLVMVIGVIDFGLAFREQFHLEAAARAGLQKGFMDMWAKDDIATAVKESFSSDTEEQKTLTISNSSSCYCDGSLTGSGDTCIATTMCGGGGNPEFYLTVTVTKPHNLFFNYFAIPQVITLSGTATARAQPNKAY